MSWRLANIRLVTVPAANASVPMNGKKFSFMRPPSVSGPTQSAIAAT
jgi:hypothetical protein